MARYDCERCEKVCFTTNPPHLCKDVQARLTEYRNRRRSYLLRLVKGKRCPTHGKLFQVRCGQKTCGLCYEEFLLTAPDRNRSVKLEPVPEDYFKPKGFSGHGQKAPK